MVSYSESSSEEIEYSSEDKFKYPKNFEIPKNKAKPFFFFSEPCFSTWPVEVPGELMLDELAAIYVSQ